MPARTAAPDHLSYQAWRGIYHAELQRRAEVATLTKLNRGGMVGRLQLGYEYGAGGTPILDPSREALLREAFLLAAEGTRSLRSIQSELTDRGLTARSGRLVSVSQLWRILTDPFYIGEVKYRDETFPGRHQPLVSQETFRKVQENLAGRRRR
ncbi:MAG: hypothetical protein NVSMB52_09060 [Chloroflexota bacterium]